MTYSAGQTKQYDERCLSSVINSRDEEDLLAKQPDPQRYNDEVIFPDKVRINRYYLHHYSFIKDIEMIVCTILGRHMRYDNELI